MKNYVLQESGTEEGSNVTVQFKGSAFAPRGETQQNEETKIKGSSCDKNPDSPNNS